MHAESAEVLDEFRLNLVLVYTKLIRFGLYQSSVIPTSHGLRPSVVFFFLFKKLKFATRTDGWYLTSH